MEEYSDRPWLAPPFSLLISAYDIARYLGRKLIKCCKFCKCCKKNSGSEMIDGGESSKAETGKLSKASLNFPI